MRKGRQMFTAIEFAFVASIVTGFGALGIAGLVFGFQMSQWSEWQGVIAGMAVTAAAVLGAVFGLYAALKPIQ
jgi:hypothetical protein